MTGLKLTLILLALLIALAIVAEARADVTAPLAGTSAASPTVTGTSTSTRRAPLPPATPHGSATSLDGSGNRLHLGFFTAGSGAVSFVERRSTNDSRRSFDRHQPSDRAGPGLRMCVVLPGNEPNTGRRPAERDRAERAAGGASWSAEQSGDGSPTAPGLSARDAESGRLRTGLL